MEAERTADQIIATLSGAMTRRVPSSAVVLTVSRNVWRCPSVIARSLSDQRSNHCFHGRSTGSSWPGGSGTSTARRRCLSAWLRCSRSRSGASGSMRWMRARNACEGQSRSRESAGGDEPSEDGLRVRGPMRVTTGSAAGSAGSSRWSRAGLGGPTMRCDTRNSAHRWSREFVARSRCGCRRSRLVRGPR